MTTFEVVARARTGAEALRLADRLQPDVVLADIEMPQMTGLELAPKLVKRGMHVITLTTFARPGYLRRALDAGVHGYLLKDTPAEELARAVCDSPAPAVAPLRRSWQSKLGARPTR